MNWGNFFVNMGIVLDVGATVSYAFAHDWKKMLYWLSCTGVIIALRLMA